MQIPKQRDPFRKSIELIPNKLCIRQRKDIWHMEFKTPEGWKQRSTRTEYKPEATYFALDVYRRWDEARKLVKQSFSTYADKWVEQIDLDPKPVHPSYKGILKNWIRPFFKHRDVSTINEDTIREYEAWRNETRGKKLARDTVHNHHSIIRKILLIASKAGAMDRNQVPENFRELNTGYKGESRPIFDEDEFDDVLDELRDWHKQVVNEEHSYKRKLLYFYVQFLYHTGIRPGKEVNTLKWRNINMQWRHPIHKTEHIRVHVIRGKNGPRPAMARDGLRPYLLELQELTQHTDPREYVFCTTDGEPVKRMFDDFHRFLSGTTYRLDADDQARALYSLRHMFITRAILEATIPLNVIATNCGTSVQMIEKVYSKVSPEHFAAEFAR